MHPGGTSRGGDNTSAHHSPPDPAHSVKFEASVTLGASQCRRVRVGSAAVRSEAKFAAAAAVW